MNYNKNWGVKLVAILLSAIVGGCKPNTVISKPLNPMNNRVSCVLICFQSGDHVWSDVIFSNETDSVIPIFNGTLQKDKLTEGIGFWVQRDGNPIPYTGIMIKRPAPREDEYYKMKPHEVCRSTVNIGKYFDFSRSGNYTVGYSCITMTLLSDTNLIKLESSPVSFHK